MDAPVIDAYGVPLDGSNYVAQLYGGLTTDSLMPAINSPYGVAVTAPFLTGTGAGYFLGPSVIIPSVPCGDQAWLQVRAWDARLGATYEDVVSLNLGGYGESSLLYLRSGNPCAVPPAAPSPLTGLQSFSLRPIIPEPGVGLLLFLGLPLLFWCKPLPK